jgi:hypothetical protein
MAWRAYTFYHVLIATQPPPVVAQLPPNATLISLDDPQVPTAP